MSLSLMDCSLAGTHRDSRETHGRLTETQCRLRETRMQDDPGSHSLIFYGLHVLIQVNCVIEHENGVVFALGMSKESGYRPEKEVGVICPG